PPLRPTSPPPAPPGPVSSRRPGRRSRGGADESRRGRQAAGRRHRRAAAMTATAFDERSAGDPTEVTRRRAVRLSVLAGGAFLGLAVLSSFLPGGGGQGGGSPSSSYSNRADGTAAWAELLSRFGHHVDRLRGDLEPSTLDPAATVVVLDAPGIGDREARALGAFVRRGGHLVAGGAGSGGWLESVIDRPPDLSTRGVRRATPVGTAPPGGRA